MTVSNETSRNDYVGNGVTTSYPYTYRILADSDLLVTKRDTSDVETTLTLNADYTVTGALDLSGGSVVLSEALPSGYALTIRRKPQVIQTTDIRNGGPAFRSSIEDGLDKGAMIAQRFLEEVGRCLKLKETETGSADLTELPAVRANMVLGFDADKKPIAVSNVPTSGVSVSSFIQTLLDDADALTARGTLKVVAVVTPSALSGNTNDYGGASVDGDIVVARLSSSGNYNLTGLGISLSPKFTIIHNVGSNKITLTHQDTASSAALRIITGSEGAPIVILPNDSVTLWYDTTTFRWRVVGRSVRPIVDQAFQARLTLASGTPVTTADQTAKTTVYLTPHGGNRVALYDGTEWRMYALSEISISVPATTNTMYDIFVYDNAGTLTLEAVAWTNDTTRATALAVQDGVYVKTGTLTKRYVGSFRTTGSSGQTEDSAAKRYVWNYYNRVSRLMMVLETTDTWTYNGAALRQANNAAANQLDFVIGVSEDEVEASVQVSARSTSTSDNFFVAIGLDSTTAKHANSINTWVQSGGASSLTGPTAEIRLHPAAGRHTLVWLEYSTGVGTTTWSGDESDRAHSGIIGSLRG